MRDRFAEALYRSNRKLIEGLDHIIDTWCAENNISRDDFNKRVSDHYNEKYSKVPTLTPEEAEEFHKRFIVAASLDFKVPIRYLVVDEKEAEEIEKWKKENEDLIDSWDKENDTN